MFLILVTWLNPTAFAVAAPADLVLVFDASGSMWGQVGGEAKIVGARRALAEVASHLPADQKVALVAYGHRRDGDCADIETLVPLSLGAAEKLKTAVERLQPKGKTPISGRARPGLRPDRSEGDHRLDQRRSRNLRRRSLCARQGRQSCRREFLLHVVGLDLAKEDVSTLECVAQAGGGLFLGVENAQQLRTALELVAQETPQGDGRLIVTAKADGKLLDVVISVQGGSLKEELNSRTYTRAETNPRTLPLPAGRYSAEVRAIGLKGDIERTFSFEIEKDRDVEKSFDFSTGKLSLGATRNGELTDVLYTVFVAGTRQVAAQGRTYDQASSNPALVDLTAGHYEVEIAAIEISGRPEVRLGKVEIVPESPALLTHDFRSGQLRIGVTRAGALVDATVKVTRAGKSVDAGRTYVKPETNPKTFDLEPGDYDVEVKEIRGESRRLKVRIEAAQVVEQIFDLSKTP